MPQRVNSQGPPGPPGDTGATGATGRTGLRGFTGSVGPVGLRGEPGLPGPPGPSAPGSTGNPGPPGPPGYRGSPGYPGDRGATGATGEKGRQGSTGASGRVNVVPYPRTATTTRPQHGDPCSGPRGPAGPRGATGATGYTGRLGHTGAPGLIGPHGSPGSRGPAGRPGGGGNAGPAGPQGSTGPPGVPGRLGWRGVRGPFGDTGATGATGIQIQDVRRRRRQAAGCPGPKGPPGVAGATGWPGIQGFVGPPGPSGPAGVPGERGPRGSPGHAGPAGQPGPPGPQGPHGNRGPKGATGPRGPDGNAGPPGVRGATGLFRIVALSEISVDSVWPSYGPVNGGTRVTITGQFLSTSSVTFVHLGRHRLRPNANSNEMNSVVVTTPPIAIGSRLSEALWIVLQLNDGSRLHTNHTFTYRLNPVFTDIQPRNHLLVGGTEVTVSGSKLDSIADPRINLTVVVTRVVNHIVSKAPATSNLEPCKLPKADTDGSKLVCPMPVVSLPADLKHQLEQSATGVIDNSNCPGVAVYLTSHGQAHARADIYVGLELDGFDHYQNLNADRPDIKMQFALMPDISCQSEVVTLYPDRNDLLSIQGQHLQRGSHLEDFDIRLGSAKCVPVSLTDNQVDCRPPPKGPNDTYCQDDTLIRIKIGNANYNCSCNLRYVTPRETPDSDKVALIVGLCVGLGLLLLLVIVVIVVVVACRRHRNKRNEQTAERNVAFTGNQRGERYVELEEDNRNLSANPAAANESQNNNEFACARADVPDENKKYTALGELDPTYNNPPCYSSLQKNYEC